MFERFTWMMALRYFRAKKREKFVSVISIISLIGIAIGVAALIVVMSVMNGFRIELTKNITGLNGDLIVKPIYSHIVNSDDKVEKIREILDTTYVITSVVGQSLASFSDVNSGVIVRGLDKDDLKHKGEILGNVMQGSFDDYDEDSIVIGNELARSLGVFSGDRVKLISPSTLATIFGSLPRMKEFKVAAIFNSGLYDYDSATVIMNKETARKFYGYGDDINLIEIGLKEVGNLEIQSQKLQSSLSEGVIVTSWLHENQQFLRALEIERVAMFVILSLIIIVAAFNIISSLFMLVKDKTKDIAILRTIGASQSQIMKIFILNGMFIGTLGTSIGVISGWLLASNVENLRILLENLSGNTIFDPAIYFLYSLPSSPQITDVIFVSFMAIILSYLATIYPAYRGSSLNPVEAMRYE